MPASGSCWLTSKPCFSEGTHTSLLAAQSAWLAAENDELLVGEPGPTPEYRKRVTSLAPPPVALDMALLAKRRHGRRHRMQELAETTKESKVERCRRRRNVMDGQTDCVLGART